MILDRNVFVLLLLIAYVKGEPKWKLKYPHEVYVQDRNNPDVEPVIGCICRVEDKIEVLVPASINPAQRELIIRYRNVNGEVVKTEAERYRETANRFLLLLTPMPKIVRSRYTEAVPIPPPNRLDTYSLNFDLPPIVAKVTDSYGNEITFTNSRPITSRGLVGGTQRKSEILIECIEYNYRLVKGATLLTERLREELSDDRAAEIHSSDEGVIGMFEEHKDGFLHFNIFDEFTVRTDDLGGYRWVASGVA